MTSGKYFGTLKAEGIVWRCAYSAVPSTQRLDPPKVANNMRLFSAFGLVVVFVLFAVMMPRVFHDLEATLHQFLLVAQEALSISSDFLATTSAYLPK